MEQLSEDCQKVLEELTEQCESRESVERLIKESTMFFGLT